MRRTSSYSLEDGAGDQMSLRIHRVWDICPHTLFTSLSLTDTHSGTGALCDGIEQVERMSEKRV